jgi:hypothetical protein
MQDNNLLPKWGDLAPVERHELLGKVIDAMIYHGEAVDILQKLVTTFERKGWVHSIILPKDNLQDAIDYQDELFIK